jgi:hypothetical protein
VCSISLGVIGNRFLLFVYLFTAHLTTYQYLRDSSDGIATRLRAARRRRRGSIPDRRKKFLSFT